MRLVLGILLSGLALSYPEPTETTNDKIAGVIDKMFRSFIVPQDEAQLLHEEKGTKPPSMPGTDLYGIIISSSKYMQNYRHEMNALAIYRLMKWFGMPDDHLYLMIGECSSCDPRNALHGQAYISPSHHVDLNKGVLRIAFKNGLASSKSWTTLLTGRFLTPYYSLKSRFFPTPTARGQSIGPLGAPPGPGADVLIYLNGHGGSGFTKFRDFDELSTMEIDHTLYELKLKGGFNRVLLLVDSCQAYTLGERLHTPDVLIIASSVKGKNAYSCNDDYTLAVSLSDRFTYLTFIDLTFNRKFKAPLHTWHKSLDRAFLISEPKIHPYVNGSETLIDWLAPPRFRHVLTKTAPRHETLGTDPIVITDRIF